MSEHISGISIALDAIELIFELMTHVSETEPFPDANKTLIISACDDHVTIMGTEEELEAIADSILLAVTQNKVARARLEEWKRNR